MWNPIKFYGSDVNKLFDLYSFHEADIVIKNSEIEEYLNKVKLYYFNDLQEVCGKPLKTKLKNVTFHKDTKFLGAYEHVLLPRRYGPYEGIILDFKHEEDAFYFKLKFC